MVMKTGKRMIIADVVASLSPEDKIKYPILIAENLTAMVAIPLCYNNQVYGVLLLGQRDGKSLPDYETLDISGKLWTFSEEMQVFKMLDVDNLDLENLLKILRKDE